MREVDKDLNHDNVDYKMFTSWYKFPLYECNFRCGKPSWVSSICMSIEIIILIDTKDGNENKKWVSLDEFEMLHFQQDQNIKTFSYS